MDDGTIRAFCALFRTAANEPIPFPDTLEPKALKWDAEHSVWSHDNAWGRADIIALVADQPAIIIENKLAAGVRDAQIGIYRDALEAGPVGRPLLLFLTDTTEPPSDFREEVNSRVLHGSARWSEVYRFLASLGRSDDGASALQALSSEFASFLKSKGLHMDLMSTTDAAVLRLWMDVESRVETTVSAIFNPVWSALAPWRKGTKGSRYSEKVGAYAYSADFRADGKDCWAYIEAGLIFPDLTDWWATETASSPQAFVLIRSYNDDPLPSLSELSWPKSPDGKELGVIADFQKMVSDDSQAQVRISEWVDTVARELKAALPKPA